MAANKFATMLHRNTNKMTLILIYAVLEWILIILLLLNSLFSYLIIKFADYFGLKTPCIWCSRVDHFIDPVKNKNSHRDHLCESHAREISQLGYCSDHQKLAQSQDMCEDCSSSRPDYRKNLAFFPWIKEIGMIQSEGEKVIENGEVGIECSCCGVRFEREILSPYIVIKPSLGVLDYTQKGSLTTEAGDDDRVEEGDDSDRSRSDSGVNREIEARNRAAFVMDQYQDEDEDEDEDEDVAEEKGDELMISEENEDFGVRKQEAEVDCSVSLSNSGLREMEGDEDDKEDKSNLIIEDSFSGEKMTEICAKQDPSIEILPQHLEFFVGHGGFRLIPVELIDSATEENQRNNRVKEEDDENCENHEADFSTESRDVVLDEEAELSAFENKEESKFAVVESMEIEENENSLIFHPKQCDLVREVYEHVEPQTTSMEIYDSDVPTVTEGEFQIPINEVDAFQIPINETEAEVSIGTEIPDLEQADDFQNQEIENIPPYSSTDEDPSSHFGSNPAEEESVELKTSTMSVEVRENVMNNQTSIGSELNENEEDRVPDTPTSIENLHQLHKKLLLLEKRESANEESLDGSVISEFECGEGGVSIEHLKSALRAERKALHALYTELEEERSASAVAANQTMAMINRLQEEKAAMQMEALQYQRMMEEQSEYDQEALQLLNELMVKREREKEEVERELEVYRKRVLEYESKQRMRMLRRSESSFASSSNAGDSDGLSIDLNHEAKEEDGFDHENGNNHNTPVDAVLNFEESLANFEEERMSILEQLKVLEEKLFTIDGDEEEEQHFEDIKPIEDFYKENGNHLNFGGEEVNGFGNGFPNGKHHQEGTRIIGGKGKRLLPLFDAIGAENEDMVENGHVNGFHSHMLENSNGKRSEMENKSVDIEEEVDHLYERLQALEADREFLKHCISSLKKGEKGMDLLQEILQHLRDLRNVESRAKNLSSDGIALV